MYYVYSCNICRLACLVCIYYLYCVCLVQRGKRKARERSENAKRKRSKSSNGSLGRAENNQLKNGDVEAVTLFEVVSMGRSAMQVHPVKKLKYPILLHYE